ncbi:MAG: CARDB domain-containing protein, partial [Pseudomonadota bacterium]
VTPGLAPDLTLTAPAVNPVSVNESAALQLSVTLDNIGNDNAPGTTIRVFLSTDAEIDIMDTEQSQLAVASLNAGNTQSYSIGFTGPGTFGDFFVGACVDDVLNEDNLFNNCSSAVQFSVSPSSDALGVALDHPNATWATGGEATMAVQTDDFLVGDSAVETGALNDSESSWVEAQFEGPMTVEFMWQVDSEENHDFLHVKVNGAIQSSISGRGAGWQLGSVNIPSGTHAIRWEYEKDASNSLGEDKAWIDALSVQDDQLCVIVKAANDVVFPICL